MTRYFTLMAIVIFITTACDQKKQDVAAPPRMVKVIDVVASGESQQRIFPARIESGDSTDLSFKRGGQIESLDIRQGTRVEQGQQIARLTAREAQQRVNERQTAATLAQRQFARFQTLSGRQAISQADMDVQRANRDAANAALQIAREELSQMTLTAPFSGTAANVNVRNHQVVAAGQTIATLTRTDLLDVVFSVPENLFTALDMRNMTYRPVVRINTLPDREFQAEYKEHTGSSSSNTLTWQVILTMPRPVDFPAVGGVSGTVTINLANLPANVHRESLVVPVEAVFNPDNSQRNQPHVWVVQGSGDQLHLEDRKVSVGEVTDRGVVITAGLQAGERVVAAGVNELHAQQPVRIWTRERGL
ncbi:membrane protein [Pantoea sp. RIT-PI-b]|uniref:efflux RND transporter periplasmic adaptor subunit n=1 Tax=unclassified Pantoea TaxID=2630326 RepID=UPI0002710E9C|nr:MULTISPECIES: efflux RND transporter periplasmic adaptor subunit [unclassified Pantoea]EJL92521.1 RND family efflux transporter, MFP subunit [Pantoea sp. GM01]KNC05739.1 membrane protein [Pantoea sp. RIT-PI-b]